MSKSVVALCCAVLVVGAMSVAQPVVSEEHPGEPISERVSTPKHKAEERIEKILHSPLKSPLEFTELPLIEITSILSDEYQIPIVIDLAALDEIAISPEQEITLNIRNLSLHSALTLMFRQPGLEDLTFTIDNETLLITTEDRAEENVVVKVYRVDDLLSPSRQQFNSLGYDFDELIDVIIAIVEPDVWMENGTGVGEIMPYDPGMLVICQTRRIHEQIEDLLAKLRNSKLAIESEHKDPSTKQSLVSHGFKIAPDALKLTDDSEEVAELLSETLVESVQWDAVDDNDTTKVWLRVLPGLVMVRHTPQVVNQVGIVMADLGLRKGGGAIGCYGGGVVVPPHSGTKSNPPKGGGS